MDLTRPEAETPVSRVNHFTMPHREAAAILLGRLLEDDEEVRIFTDDAGDLHILVAREV